MLIGIVCYDKPNHVDLRMKTRPVHLEYMETFAGQLLYAGPILTDDGASPMGSLIIGDFADLNAARAFNAGDPYTKAGLFEKVSMHPTRKVFANGRLV